MFGLTLFNPKALVIVLGLMQSAQGWYDLTVECVIVAVGVLIAAASWAAAGAYRKRFRAVTNDRAAMSASLVLACFSVWFAAVGVTHFVE